MKKMKYVSIIALLFSIVILEGCKKDEPEPVETPPPAPAPSIGPVPSTFTRKVLVEEFTGAWCGYCPDGALILEEMIEANPTRIVGVSVHQGDGMDDLSPSIWTSDKFIGTFSIAGYPSGMVGRVPYNGTVAMNREDWEYAGEAEMAKTASCGLAMDSKFNAAKDSATVIVHAGFNQTVSGTLRLTIYLVEDSVTGGSTYDQANYYSSDYGSNAVGGPNHPFYNMEAEIKGFNHMQVLRKIATANTGDTIATASNVAGGEYVLTKTIPLKSTYDTNNLKVVAFIHIKGATSSTHEVLNVQQVKIGSLKNWD